MARVFKRKDRLSAMSEINLTSLMDLVFCLLIIFMITTPLLEQTIPLNLPTQAQSNCLTTDGQRGRHTGGRSGYLRLREGRLFDIVVKEVEVLVLNRDRFHSLVQQRPAVLMELCATLVRRLRKAAA